MHDLDGKKILVVEDDHQLANDVCRQIRELGATVIGPAPTVFYASQLIGRQRIDAALLDITLHGELVFDIARRLVDRGVPFLFASSGEQNLVPPPLAGYPILAKPFTAPQLAVQLVKLVRRASAGPAVQAPGLHIVRSPDLPIQAFARALARCLGRQPASR